MTGTTPICAACGRPVMRAPAVYGNAGEPYHVECTHPPMPTQRFGERCFGDKADIYKFKAEALHTQLLSHGITPVVDV